MKRRSFLQSLATAPALASVPVSLGLINAAKAATQGTGKTNFVFFYLTSIRLTALGTFFQLSIGVSSFIL